jgi:hypothetical protein
MLRSEPVGSYGHGRPSGVRCRTAPSSHGEPARFHGIMRSASDKGAAAAGAVDPTERPSALLIAPSSGSPASAPAWQ